MRKTGNIKQSAPTRSSWRGTDCGLTYFFYEFGGSPRRTAAQESRGKGPIKQAQGLSEGGRSGTQPSATSPADSDGVVEL